MRLRENWTGRFVYVQGTDPLTPKIITHASYAQRSMSKMVWSTSRWRTQRRTSWLPKRWKRSFLLSLETMDGSSLWRRGGSAPSSTGVRRSMILKSAIRCPCTSRVMWSRTSRSPSKTSCRRTDSTSLVKSIHMQLVLVNPSRPHSWCMRDCTSSISVGTIRSRSSQETLKVAYQGMPRPPRTRLSKESYKHGYVRTCNKRRGKTGARAHMFKQRLVGTPMDWFRS